MAVYLVRTSFVGHHPVRQLFTPEISGDGAIIAADKQVNPDGGSRTLTLTRIGSGSVITVASVSLAAEDIEPIAVDQSADALAYETESLNRNGVAEPMNLFLYRNGTSLGAVRGLAVSSRPG